MSALSDIKGAVVLIVDDMPAMISAVALALEEVGLQVLVAEDGEEALSRSALMRPDLILLDIMMPGMDGFEVCYRLKQDKDTADIPVIFMTGMSQQADTIRGFEAGAVDYVIKPLRIDETVARITTHVRLRLMHRRVTMQYDELVLYREHLEELVAERTAMLDERNRQLRAEIDERQAANREIQAKESLLRALIDSIPDLIFFKDIHSVYLGFNRAFAEYCGKTESELVGKTDHAFAPPDIAEFFRATDRRMLASGKSQRIEEEVIYPDGRKVLLDTLKTPLQDTHGNIIGLIGVSRDITERKNMEAELVKREREYRTLSENSPNSIVRYDLDCKRIYFNQAYISLSRHDPQELLGKTPEECWWLEAPTAADYTKKLREVMNLGLPGEETSRFMGDDGEIHQGIVYFVPEFDQEGKVFSVLAIGHDITRLKRMEDKLRRSEMEFRTLAENSPDMIVRYDTECRRIFINPAYEKYTGTPLAQAWNKTPDEVWVPLMPRQEYTERLRQVMKTGVPDQILLEWYQSDGSLTSHLMHTVAEYDAEGKVIGALVIGHNISDLKRTERSLQKSRTQLRALTARLERAREQERKRIAREIHDELGQLLSLLRLNVNMLEYQFGESNPALAKKTQGIVGTVDRAITMVRNLATELRPAVLAAGLPAALEWLVQEFAENTDLNFDFDIESSDIPLDETRAMLVFRIVQESLTNILRHSQADTVTIKVERTDTDCMISVIDNGMGFDPDQIANPRSLGLLGMRERALVLGGILEVESEPQKGTRISLQVPLDNQPVLFSKNE